MSKSIECSSCPWGESKEAIYGINWGCLPCPSDMIKENAEDRAISCHNNGKKVCSGLRNYLAENNIKESEIISYREWIHGE